MKGLVAVARREFLRQRFVLAAATAASLVPITVPLVRSLAGEDAAHARAWTALLLSTAFAIGLVVALGAVTLAAAIASRRIAFDFARPVSSLAIWAGGGLAACAIAVASGAIIWIPAWLLGARLPWQDLVVDTELPRFSAWLLLGGLAALFCISHAASVLTRSRSALLALDAVLAVAAALTLPAILSSLPSFLASEPRARVGWGFAIVVGAGFAAAGLASVARGRTDIRAAHRALSQTLWPCVGIVLAGAAAYASWVMAAAPHDIAGGFLVTPAPTGTWVEVAGRARGADATFLYDTASGRFARAATRDWLSPVISRDGRHAAWVEGRSGGGPFEILTMRLDEEKTGGIRTRLFLQSYPSLLVLSPDGSRVATAVDGVLSVHDVAGGRTLSSARVGDGPDELRGFFTGNELFRVYACPDPRAPAPRIRILELDIASKSLQQTGELDPPAGGLFFVATPSGDRLIAVAHEDKAAWLCDGRTGRVMAQLSPGGNAISNWPGFLADDRVVLAERTTGTVRLSIFRSDGSPERTIPLAMAAWVSLGAEPAPGHLVVAIGEGGTYASHLVDLGDGTLRKIADGLWPVARLSSVADLGASPSRGSVATRLFTRSREELVLVDLGTGAQTILLGSPQSPRATQ
jgi:hypothetical protein